MPLAILDFTDALAPHFDAINRAWIEAMFAVEPHDDEADAPFPEQLFDQARDDTHANQYLAISAWPGPTAFSAAIAPALSPDCTSAWPSRKLTRS